MPDIDVAFDIEPEDIVPLADAVDVDWCMQLAFEAVEFDTLDIEVVLLFIDASCDWVTIFTVTCGLVVELPEEAVTVCGARIGTVPTLHTSGPLAEEVWPEVAVEFAAVLVEVLGADAVFVADELLPVFTHCALELPVELELLTCVEPALVELAVPT